MNEIPKAPLCKIDGQRTLGGDQLVQLEFDHIYYTKEAEKLVAQARQDTLKQVGEWLLDTPYRGSSLPLAFRESFLKGEVKK